ncbi:hypothetical protein GCM10009104_12580 [Marinobacterium maritimum]|uniref:Uncharacterized protein n=1 Tax=Marinobacterium maritimum TaxID=500162 RepID=A0ABN1I4C4_9GAMM
MNVDKAKKRIAKHVKKGFKGYPEVSLSYFGKSPDFATEVVVTYIEAEGSEPQEQRLVSETDVRDDETIQSVLIKIIERSGAATVTEKSGVSLI